MASDTKSGDVVSDGGRQPFTTTPLQKPIYTPQSLRQPPKAKFNRFKFRARRNNRWHNKPSAAILASGSPQTVQAAATGNDDARRVLLAAWELGANLAGVHPV